MTNLKDESREPGRGVSSVRRLIEVDLPIRRISGHASREKSIRHGHISTLHVWWARRPLAACRAVTCAALWPDPADPSCPNDFVEAARRSMTAWSMQHLVLLGDESFQRFVRYQQDPSILESADELRWALLDFIADFSAWKNSTRSEYLETARALTLAAHEALDGLPGTRPMVVDPFAGGGSIPLEASRIGADAFASDLNPLAVLLNKVALEYVPQYGERLADEVRDWGEWIKQELEEEVSSYFPVEDPNAPPVAYIWARTIRCEGPGCGVEVPLIRSPLLAKRGNASIALNLVPNDAQGAINVEIVTGSKVGSGTVKRGSATCPRCGYTTSVARVREQLKRAGGGADTSRLLVTVQRSSSGKKYRVPSPEDIEAAEVAGRTLNREDVLPPTELPLMSGVFNVPIYGMTRWDLLFSARQLLVAELLQEKIDAAFHKIREAYSDDTLAVAVKTLLTLALGKYLDFRSTLCGWINVGEKIGHTFGRQALGMIFDWAEGVPFGDISGSWERSVAYLAEFLETEASAESLKGTVVQADAQLSPMPDDSAQAFITDPPYYNAVPYADLSDFFYLWFRKGLGREYSTLFSAPTAPKAEELCEMSGWDPVRYAHKDAAFYEAGMRRAFSEARRVCSPTGIGVVVFAHKSTTGWETLLSALIDSGWIVTASWPIDTERSGRLRAMKSAALASSVHLVCRPREAIDGSKLEDTVGDWREVLQELPGRIHQWMPRLAEEGVVGADAIFACLGPALEIFSRYSRVEKASGEEVELSEYMEHVWAAVAREALSVILEDVDVTGFEPDARLTAMWLWTLSAGANGNKVASEEQASDSLLISEGYSLEYDAARKIAQGLGAHLERLESVVHIKGETARLLPVAERTRYLFGKDDGQTQERKRQQAQLSMFATLDEAGEQDGFGAPDALEAGNTVLDRIHQSMILFAAGRSEAMRRFLVEEGVGQDQRFWRLAQALSALYPAGTDEKRWVDGVLARKKGLGY